MRATVMRTDIREAILDAVDRRLARLGYKKMTVEGLAEEAGIGKGTVYLHFPSKEEEVLSHVDRIFECKVQKSRQAATPYSWIRPPSRSRRWA